MNEETPITSVQAVWVLFKLALRRFLNRCQNLRLARKKSTAPEPAKRTGTAGKSTVSWIYPVFFFGIFTVNGFNFASRVLMQVTHSVAGIDAPAGLALVNYACYEDVRKAENAFKDIDQVRSEDFRLRSRKEWTLWLDQAFENEVRRENLADEEAQDRLAYFKSVFAEKGSAGFAVNGPAGFMSSQDWPTAEQEPFFINSIGFMTGLFVLASVALSLGLANKDLGQVEWSFEWFYTFPTSARALYFSKLVSTSLLNPAAWMFLFPFLLYAFLVSAWTWSHVFLAVLTVAYFLLLGGALAMVIEVAARKFLSLSGLKNLQAFCTIFGMVCLLSYFACAGSHAVANYYVHSIASLPGFILWQPFSFPAVLMARYASSSQFVLSLSSLFFWSLVAFGSVYFCEWITREGLVRAGGPYQGARRQKAGSPSAGWLAGIPGKEMRLLLRDRNIMVQVLVSPLIIVVFYLVTNSSILSAAKGNFHHAATLAFCVGAYGLASSAMQILNHEKGTLWQLFVFPRPLLSILAEKTMVWAGFAFLYTATTLVALAFFSRHLHPSALGDGFLALYGVILYAFIAAGIGILATNPLEETPRARMRADMLYLYMLLIGMYAFTIYVPSSWTKIAQLVLSTLLAFALWQKARDRLPYLLDPHATPPATVSLSDGLIAALAFFVMQGCLGLLLHQDKSMPEIVQLTLAYSIAGICTASLTLYTLWRHKVSDLWAYLGFVSTRHSSTLQGLGGSLAYGLAGGGLSAIGAAIYLHVLTLVPSWETWMDDARSQALFSGVDHSLWLLVLAVIAAPLCEEFIFRGLIYRGLRRSLHPALAILASAALFALVHPAVSVIPVFGLGLAAAFCFERTGLLLAPIVAHMTYNACVFFLNQ